MTGIESPPKRDAVPAVWPVSSTAYHALGELGLIPERTELLYGQVFYKMPKSPYHVFLLLRLLEMIRSILPADVHARPEQPLTCGDSEPEPGISIVEGAIGDYARAHPRTARLVVEICVTSYEYDRSKLRAYALAGVQECWLVLGNEKMIEMFRRPFEGEFSEHTMHGPGGSVTSSAVAAVVVDLDVLFS